MKALNNLGWMLLGVAVGSGALYCYNECSCNGGVKQTINKANSIKKIFLLECNVSVLMVS